MVRVKVNCWEQRYGLSNRSEAASIRDPMCLSEWSHPDQDISVCWRGFAVVRVDTSLFR